MESQEDKLNKAQEAARATGRTPKGHPPLPLGIIKDLGEATVSIAFVKEGRVHDSFSIVPLLRLC